MTPAGAIGSVPSDADLIARLRSSGDGAYEELFRRHAPAVRRYARSCCRDAHTADVLTAEVFAWMLREVRGGAGPQDAVRASLLAAVRQVAAGWVVSAGREQLVDDFAAFAAQHLHRAAGTGDRALAPSAAVLAMWEAEQSLAVQAFHSLPERWQAVLWHTEVEDESPGDVAVLLGLDADGVWSLADQARAGLKQAYLQAHVSAALAADADCARHADRLGAYVRGGLRSQAERGLRRHLAECARCRLAVGQIKEASRGIPGAVPVAVIGWFGPDGYGKVAALFAGGSEGVGEAGTRESGVAPEGGVSRAGAEVVADSAGASGAAGAAGVVGVAGAAGVVGTAGMVGRGGDAGEGGTGGSSGSVGSSDVDGAGGAGGAGGATSSGDSPGAAGVSGSGSVGAAGSSRAGGAAGAPGTAGTGDSRGAAGAGGASAMAVAGGSAGAAGYLGTTGSVGTAGSASAAGATGSGGAGETGSGIAEGAAVGNEGGVPVKAGVTVVVAAAVAAVVVLALVGGEGKPPSEPSAKPPASQPQQPPEDTGPKPERPPVAHPMPTPSPSHTPTPRPTPASAAKHTPDAHRASTPPPDKPGPPPSKPPESTPGPPPGPVPISYPMSQLKYAPHGNGSAPEIRAGSGWLWQRQSLHVGGRQYAQGATVHGSSSVTVDLNRSCTAYDAYVGVDDTTLGLGSVRFAVVADGVRLWQSPVVRGGDPALPVHVALAGRSTVRLVVTPYGVLDAVVLADWAQARFLCR